MADLDPLSFKGTSPEECEVFVSTIRQRALAQGKHRDNEWIAFLASSYFVGDAFYWYEELGADVQNDWSRLRPALVARFGRRSSTSATMSSPSTIPASTPSNSIPTPAAAPPAGISLPLVRKGHLKVLSSDGSLRGYVEKRPNPNGNFNVLSPRLDDALLVSFPVLPAGEALEIQIISENAFQRPHLSNPLAITWWNPRGYQWNDEISWFQMCCGSFAIEASKWSWVTEQKVWKILKEGELIVECPIPDVGTERLHCYVESGIWFRKFLSAGYKPGRIIFEDVA